MGTWVRGYVGNKRIRGYMGTWVINGYTGCVCGFESMWEWSQVRMVEFNEHTRDGHSAYPPPPRGEKAST